MDKIKKFKSVLKKYPHYFKLIKNLKNYYKKKFEESNNDTKYIYLAALESIKAFLKGEIPVGCVLISPEGKIFKAHNLKETLKDPTAHAEILAIRKAARYYNTWFLKNFKIYITLEPCLMCFSSLMESRITDVYYGYLEPKYGFSNFIKKDKFSKLMIKNFNLSDITIPIKIFFKLLRREQ